MSTNVPVPTLTTTGYSTPADSAILNGVCLDIQGAFGNALNLSAAPVGGQPNSSLSTPQGQLASSISAMISDCYAQFLQVVSQTDPQYAQGSMQDAIGNIYFMKRIPASGTGVNATITGAPNTVIPFGVAVAQDYNGNLYSCASTSGTQAIIPIGGSLACVFTNMTMGAIAFPSAQPLTIYQTTPGWDAITGATQISLGALAESAQAFETRRQQSVAVNSQSSIQAVKSYVLTALANSGSGASVYVMENSTNGLVSSGGISLLANSIYVAAQPGVSGISASVIANAIWQSKSAGCSYTPSVIGTLTTVNGSPNLTVNPVTSGYILIGQTIASVNVPVGATILSQTSGVGGGAGVYVISASPSVGAGPTAFTASTSVSVVDQSYAVPQPTYTVSFTTPQALPIFFQVTLASSFNPPSTALATLQSTIPTQLLAVAGIGATIYGSAFYSTISSNIPNAQILSVLTAAGSSFTASTATSVLTVTAMSPTGSVPLAVGQTVYKLDGTVIGNISTLGTGTGGIGTYNLSTTPGTIASIAMQAVSFSGNPTQVLTNINQYPVYGTTFLVLA
jgi:hypothetical protein